MPVYFMEKKRQRRVLVEHGRAVGADAVHFVQKKGPRRVTRRTRARASDILGAAKPPLTVPPKWKKPYQRLLETRDYLLHRKGDLAKDAAEERPAYSMHMADAGTDEFDRDFALSMMSSEQNALYEIEEAINRIRDGTYGICELTGKRIELQRLEAIPWTRFSAEAEKQLEKEGGVARARLGPREEVPKMAAPDPEEDLESE